MKPKVIHLHTTTMAKIKIDNIDIVEDKEQENAYIAMRTKITIL